MKSTACMLALLGLGTTLGTPGFAQSHLILPQTPDEVRALTQSADPAGACPTCGTLVNVRSEQREAPPKRTAPAAGSGLQTTTVLASGTTPKALREARQARQTYYTLVVRHDDGSFASYEQDEAPSLTKGDRVEVVAGRVQARVR